ncbi:MAG TPA: EAL domain-containing protein [Chloroflexia bacterium]|nr:EAL domain-containing protein [Chloroflexia bacterium]
MTSQVIVLDGFARQEESDTSNDVQRVTSALADRLATLEGTTRDWAYWDDTYAYIEDSNDAYFKSNLAADTALSSNRLSIMAFVHSTGRLVYGKAYNLREGASVPFPESLRTHIKPGSLLISHSNPESTITGLLSLPEDPMLVASVPILTSDSKGPARGTLIFGRYLDSEEIAHLARNTPFTLTAAMVGDPAMPADFAEALSSVSWGSPTFVKPMSDDVIAGYTLLNDIYDRPALLFKAEAPRSVYAQGRATFLYLMVALVIGGAAFGVAMMLMLAKTILSRLSRLRHKVSSITASGDLAARIEMPGKDELSYLAGDINGMLETLDSAQHERQASESKYRVLMEQASDGIAVYDFKGNIVQANARACEMLGYSLEEMLAMNLRDVVDAEDMARTPIRFDELLTGKVVLSERILRRKDGTCFPTEISAKLLSGQEGIQAIVRDITERKQAEEALRVEKDFSDSLIHSSVDGIVAFDGDCRYTVWNPAMERITGFTREQVLGRCAFDVFPFLMQIGQDEFFYQALAGNTVISTNRPYTIPETGKEGFYEGRYSPLHNREGEVVGGLAIICDITERRNLQEQLSHKAFHDDLTGLSNRALFMDRLMHALARSSRREDSVAVLFLDLDDFKVINDSLGHKSGDQLLIEMGERLKRCVRTDDTVARLGGDEFTVLLEDIPDLNTAVITAERIAEQLQLPFNLEGHEVFVTTSLGIAISASGSREPEDLLRNADVAMYEAKNKGKSRYAVFDTAMNTRAWQRLEMEIQLRRALERGDFLIHYQPVVRLDTGQIVEVEALARWDHKSGRLFTPNEFIPVAEEIGLIVPLGQWMLREACKQVYAWHLAHPSSQPLLLSVNVSARQLKDPRLVQDITRVLNEIGFDPTLLKLEITESVALDDTDTTLATLEELRKLGIRLAIDDFGTGYSALSYLKRYQVDTLKIDRSFIDGLGRNLEDTAIVRAVVAFAKTLSLNVTAEGIETTEQLSFLQELGCEFGQGYYFSKPLPSYELEEMLTASNLYMPVPVAADPVAV